MTEKQQWNDVKTLFAIKFKKLKPLPVAVEDVFGGIVKDKVIFSCGFGGNINKGSSREFYDQTYQVKLDDILKNEINYQKLENFPGRSRQKGGSLVIDDKLYCWGGYNYQPCQNLTTKVLASKKTNPKAFMDGYVYNTTTGEWAKLVDLPCYLSSFSITHVGDYFYLFGGCDFYDSSFNTWHDRNGENEGFGSRLYRLRVDQSLFEKGGKWERLSSCPGTPRMNHIGTEINGFLYIIGGCTGRPHGGKCYSTVDNWKYCLKTDKWIRIRDTPTSNTNWQSSIVFENRYIFLVGGALTTNAGRFCNERLVIDVNKNESGAYGVQRHNKLNDYEGIMSGEILVYDVNENKFSKVDAENGGVPLPVNLNNPLVMLSNDKLLVLGGEVEISGAMRKKIGTKLHCYSSDIFMIGKIKKIDL